MKKFLNNLPVKLKNNTSKRSIHNLTASWDLARAAKIMFIFAIVIAIGAFYLWYSRLFMTDTQRFWVAIQNSMSTQSVNRTLTEGGSGNQVVQNQQFFFSPQMVTRNKVSFTQKSATVDTFVQTEGIVFPDAQFSRYTIFRTNQQRKDGSTPSLDSVLGKWEGTNFSGAEAERSKQNYLGELVTLAIFGNFDPNYRRELMSRIQNENIYEVNSNGIKTQVEDGATILYVPVSVKIKQYAEVLQDTFLRSGYGELDVLSPDNFRDDSKISAVYKVDRGSNSIVGISFGTREEIYSGYGVDLQILAPESDFSSGELEKIVQNEIQDAL